MTDADLAAERLRRVKAGEPLKAVYPEVADFAPSACGVARWKDCELLADAYLALAERDRRLAEQCHAALDNPGGISRHDLANYILAELEK